MKIINNYNVFQFDFRNNHQVVITRLHSNFEKICLLDRKYYNIPMSLYISQGSRIHFKKGLPDYRIPITAIGFGREDPKTYRKRQF